MAPAKPASGGHVHQQRDDTKGPAKDVPKAAIETPKPESQCFTDEYTVTTVLTDPNGNSTTVIKKDTEYFYLGSSDTFSTRDACEAEAAKNLGLNPPSLTDDPAIKDKTAPLQGVWKYF